MTSNHTTYRAVSRRDFLRLGGLAMAAAAALLAGCRPSGGEQTAFDDSGQSDAPAAVATATIVVQSATATPALPTATPLPQQNLGVACPFGLVNDPFPGRCKRYVDANGDGYCDNSVLGSGNMKVQTG
jgi:hypothetical protein